MNKKLSHGGTAQHSRNQKNIHHRATETLRKANSKANRSTRRRRRPRRESSRRAKIQRASCTEATEKKVFFVSPCPLRLCEKLFFLFGSPRYQLTPPLSPAIP